MKNTAFLIAGVVLLGLMVYLLSPEGLEPDNTSLYDNYEGNGMAGRLVEGVMDLYWNPTILVVAIVFLVAFGFIFSRYWKGIKD